MIALSCLVCGQFAFGKLAFPEAADFAEMRPAYAFLS
jgi:hypothetical protein